MSQAEVWTVGRLLQWTADYLKSHGADSPRLDAEVLLAHALGCRRIELYTSFERVPDEAVRTAFRELVRRRADGEPVAYLVGRREFYSLEFPRLARRADPRPETELLVVTLLDLAKGRPGKPLAVCDVGTGSGILAVCAAKFLDCRVTAIDVSPAALAVARANAEAHGVAAQIDFVCGDLLAALPPAAVFDFMLSNPPYVSDGGIRGAVARRSATSSPARPWWPVRGHGGHRPAGSASGRAAFRRRPSAAGDQSDDPRGGRCAAGRRAAIGTGPHDQGSRPPSPRGAGERKEVDEWMTTDRMVE